MTTTRHLIHAGPGFEVRAELQALPHGCGTTLTLRTRWPAARHDTAEHVVLQLTLPAEDLRSLGRYLAAEGAVP